MRGRLTLAFAAALLIGLCAFAAGALVLLREMERVTLDQQLAAAATATLGIVVDSHHHLELEPSDVEQFREVLGLQLNGAIFAANGASMASNVAEVPTPVASALDAGSGLSTVGSGEDRVRVDVVPILHEGERLGTIVLWRPLEWFAGLDRRALLASLLTIVLIGVPAIVAGAFIARRGLRPLEQIADIASEIEAHDLAQRLIDVPSPNDELGRLSVTFNRMLDRLQAAFERERRFTADASHELRAPVAVIAAEVSLALRRERDVQSYRTTLETVAESARELQVLIDALLDAARDDAGEERPATELDLAAVAGGALERLASPARERGVAFVADLEPDVIVVGEGSAIGRALVAVVHNALKFSPPGGNVTVSVRRDNGAAAVRVLDEGPGFTSAALSHALERFWRADPARSPGSGSGLGLAIARTIVERNGGSITLDNATPGGHAAVTLRLPLAQTVSFPRTIP